MRRFIIWLLAIGCWSLAFAQNTFDEANAAYADGRYADAAALYQAMIEEAPDAVLYESANGWLRQSKRRFKIFVSAKCSIGRKRSADQLLSEARELTDYLKHTKTIEEIMDEV